MVHDSTNSDKKIDVKEDLCVFIGCRFFDGNGQSASRQRARV